MLRYGGCSQASHLQLLKSVAAIWQHSWAKPAQILDALSHAIAKPAHQVVQSLRSPCHQHPMLLMLNC